MTQRARPSETCFALPLSASDGVGVALKSLLELLYGHQAPQNSSSAPTATITESTSPIQVFITMPKTF